MMLVRTSYDHRGKKNPLFFSHPKLAKMFGSLPHSRLFCSSLFAAIFLLSTSHVSCLSSSDEVATTTYREHCSSLVPESSTTVRNSRIRLFDLQTFYHTGIDGRDRRSRRDAIRFSLSGFWSETSKKLCMVGTATSLDEQGEPVDLDAVFKLSYGSDIPNIRTGVVSGVLASTATKNDPRYFDPISIFDFRPNSNYKYSVVLDEMEESHAVADVNSYPKHNQSLRLERSEFCPLIGWRNMYLDIEYADDCDKARGCSPVGGYFPLSLLLTTIQCTEDQAKARYLLKFLNSSYSYYDIQINDIASTLIGEASWDETSNELVIVACRFLDPSHHFGDAVGDCDVRLRLRFPSVWTIRSNDKALGQLWTNKKSDDPSYFKKTKILYHENDKVGFPGVKYEYTELKRAKKLCPIKKPDKKGNIYPDWRSYNMRFDMSVKDPQGGLLCWGYVVPISVEDEMYGRITNAISLAPVSETPFAEMEPVKDIRTYKPGPVNVSYQITIIPSHTFIDGNPSFKSSVAPNFQSEITAEGLYDDQTGQLCAVACRKLLKPNTSIPIHHDCEIRVSFQYSPLNGKSGGLVNGTIRSTRAKSDPLYFKEMVLISNSFYTEASERSIWRMDLEIVLVLISNTLSCIFIALQIFHVQRNPEVKPSISILMLLILTLGHMIPLVLNYEAMFLSSRDKQTFLLSTGGWLEANEVALRVITMVAFLLQIRLFQLVWNSKTSGAEGQKESWAGEKRATTVALPMYILGALVTLFLNWLRNKYGSHGRVHPKYSLWGDLRSYAGLILDGFLLPQILLNAFRSCKGNALSYPYYLGTSAIRVVPHAYDQYRMRNYPTAFTNQTYYYANPSVDFYSTAWDVVIPCGIIAFAVVVFLQQRRSGRWILLPRRFTELQPYENVPSADHE